MLINDDLIIKFLEGNASSKEILDLKEWLKDNNHRAHFDKIWKTWILTSHKEIKQKEVDKAYKAFKKKIRLLDNFNKSRLIMNRLKYAASILLILSISLFSFYYFNTTSKQVKNKYSNIVPGRSMATLITSYGTIVKLDTNIDKKINLNNGTEILINDNLISYNNQRDSNSNISKKSHIKEVNLKYNKLITPRGGEYKIVLPDGTIVYLNSETELKYPDKFDNHNRIVYLSGEAYFEVKRMPLKPFYVQTPTVKIKVYGTKFNIKTNTLNRDVETVLSSGLLGVSSLVSKEYIIKPNQLIKFDNNGNYLFTEDVNSDYYTSWKDGRFSFYKTDLREVFNILSRWYNVEFFYSKRDLGKYHFTANMTKYKNIDKILNAITEIIGVKFSIKDRCITVI